MILITLPSTNITLPASLVASLKAQGIQAETLDDLLIELASSRLVEALSSPEATASALVAGARTFGLGGASLEAVKLTEKKVTYTVADNALSFSYDAIKGALPADITFVSATTAGIGETGGRTSVRSNSGVLQLPDNPALVSFQVNLLTASGQLSLTKTVPVSSGGTVTLDVFDQTTAPADMSVQENLELLNAEVALLKQKA